ncbi:MAG: LysE family translocator [Pseudomonadota bacterium]
MLGAYFLTGLIAGFLIAMPIGPINVLCVRRTLAQGRLAGIATGLGAALADSLFAAIAVLGLTFIAGILIAERFWISLVGGAALVVVGVRTLRAAPPPLNPAADPKSLIGDFTSSVALTLTNPVTVLSFLAVFAGLGVHADDEIEASDWVLVLGVFAGSSVWWLLLTGLVGLLHGKFTDAGLRWANRIAGAVLLAFALVVLWNVAGLYA